MSTELKLSDLNDDIIRDIYSFGYPTHRVYMRDICTSIGSNHHIIDNRINAYWNENYQEGGSMTLFIKKHFTKRDILYIFHYYKKCRCCTRHSYYKPDIRHQQFNPKPEQTPYYIHDDTCSCTCRHMSRHLFNAYFN